MDSLVKRINAIPKDVQDKIRGILLNDSVNFQRIRVEPKNANTAAIYITNYLYMHKILKGTKKAFIEYLKNSLSYKNPRTNEGLKRVVMGLDKMYKVDGQQNIPVLLRAIDHNLASVLFMRGRLSLYGQYAHNLQNQDFDKLVYTYINLGIRKFKEAGLVFNRPTKYNQKYIPKSDIEQVENYIKCLNPDKRKNINSKINNQIDLFN